MKSSMSRKPIFCGHVIRKDKLHRVILEIPSRRPRRRSEIYVDRQRGRLDRMKPLWTVTHVPIGQLGLGQGPLRILEFRGPLPKF